MRKEELVEIRRIKQEGGILWFIENKNTGKWFYHTFERKEDLPCTCHKCCPNGYPFKEFKDGWTNNPEQAQGYLTKESADYSAFGCFITDEPIENIVLTEHEFVST